MLSYTACCLFACRNGPDEMHVARSKDHADAASYSKIREVSDVGRELFSAGCFFREDAVVTVVSAVDCR